MNRYACRRERVIPSMRLVRAGRALLFDVSNLTVCGHFPVAARDATATERREAEKTDQTHHADPHTDVEQFLYRRARCHSRESLRTYRTSAPIDFGLFLNFNRIRLRIT